MIVMKFRLLFMLIICTLSVVKINAEPTPTCTPLAYDLIRIYCDEIEDSYIGGETITLHILPANNNDWITTPTRFLWFSNFFPEFSGSDTEIFHLPDPPLSYCNIYVQAISNLNSSCPPYWETLDRYTRISFNCDGLNCPPTPTPSPTISPTPTPPVCTLVPIDECSKRFYMDALPNNEGEFPPEFTFSFVSPAEWASSFKNSSTGEQHPVESLGNNTYHVSNLEYGGQYELTYVCEYIECMNNYPDLVWVYISIVDQPTSPTPTMVSPALNSGWMTTQLFEKKSSECNPYSNIPPLPTPLPIQNSRAEILNQNEIIIKKDINRTYKELK